MNVNVIECCVKEIRLEIGKGNRLFLFKGDRLSVSAEPNPKNRYRVLDCSGNVIGSITKRELGWIKGETIHRSAPRRKGGGKHALVTQQQPV